jgi:hypothetical protein
LGLFGGDEAGLGHRFDGGRIGARFRSQVLDERHRGLLVCDGVGSDLTVRTAAGAHIRGATGIGYGTAAPGQRPSSAALRTSSSLEATPSLA